MSAPVSRLTLFVQFGSVKPLIDTVFDYNLLSINVLSSFSTPTLISSSSLVTHSFIPVSNLTSTFSLTPSMLRSPSLPLSGLLAGPYLRPPPFYPLSYTLARAPSAIVMFLVAIGFASAAAADILLIIRVHRIYRCLSLFSEERVRLTARPSLNPLLPILLVGRTFSVPSCAGRGGVSARISV